MSELTDLLARKGYAVSPDDVLAVLDEVLPDRDMPPGGLGRHDQVYLKQFSGLVPATEEEAEGLAARRAALATAEIARSVDRAEVARRLGISPSRVSHRQADGTLYALRVGPAKVLYPDWQFTENGSLAGLAEVVRALPEGVPAALVRRFVLAPDPDLEIDGEAVSPRIWLESGGDVARVVALARTLGDPG